MNRPSDALAERLGSVAARYRRPRAWSGRRKPALMAFNAGVKVPGDESGAAGPHARSARLGRLEAVLFLASEPLASRKLAQLANLADGTEARTMVRRLNQFYDEAGRAFRVEEVGGGFQLLSRARFAGWLRRLHQPPVEIRLSGPAMETLAVIAYRQPVPRAEIEAIRGVQCGEMLRQLMERDLVKIGGRAEELGRPFLYCTTKTFLRVFGLRHLDELPRAAALRADNRGTQPGYEVVDDPHQSTVRGLVLNDEECEVNVPVSDTVAGQIGEVDDAMSQRSRTASLRGTDDSQAELEDDDFEYEDDEEELDDEEEDDFDDEEEDEFDDDDEFDDEEDEEDDEEDDEDELEEDEWEEVEDDEDEDEDEDWDEDDDEDDDDWDEEEEVWEEA